MSNGKAHDPGRQAYGLLRFTFILAPILAGLDKFFMFLTDWDKYLSPMATSMVGGYTHTFMMVVGIIEIIAGLGVFFKPKVFSYIVAIWLALIIINLLMLGAYFDIALRDLGLFLSALALARLSKAYAK